MSTTRPPHLAYELPHLDTCHACETESPNWQAPRGNFYCDTCEQAVCRHHAMLHDGVCLECESPLTNNELDH